MATLVSKGTGNWSAAGTWEVANSTFELDAAESATQTVATAASWTSGATLTPGAMTATSIGVKVSSKGTTGTFSVRIYDVTGSAAVAGTTVTVNVTDLPSYGWVKLKFASSVALSGATNYRVEAQVSSANQVTLYRDATASNFYRFVTTSTTQSPAAGDRFYVVGDWTAAATYSANTVTFDEIGYTSQSAYPTAVSTDVGSSALLDWLNPTNVEADDTNEAISNNDGSASAGDVSWNIRASTYGFSIPTGATILGIVVTKHVSADGDGPVTDNEVRLILPSTSLSGDYKVTTDWKFNAYVNNGSPTENWGVSWTAADINDANFGVFVSATSASGGWKARIDSLKITVYYNNPIKDYGSGSTTVASMNVGSKGTFASGNTASTNYWMKLSGLWHTTGDGTTQFNTGNGSTRSSTSPTFKLQFDNAAPSDFGFSVKGATNAVWNAQGATMTPYTTLESNIVATNTVITVASTTGWLANDRVVIAPGRRTIAEYEDRVIASVDSATQITLTAGVTYPHYGTAPYKCHIMNITRNVQVYGASKTNASWVDMQSISAVDVDYCEFYNMGLSAARGFTMQTTTGSSNAQYSSFHESNEIFVITNSSAATNNNVVFSNNVLFDCATNGINMAVVPTNNNFTYDNNFGIKAPFSFSETRGSVSGNIATGAGIGMAFMDTDVTAANFGTCNGNVAYGNTNGITFQGQGFGTFGTIDVHFNAIIGLTLNGTKELTIDTPVIYGNGTVNIDVNTQNQAIFLSPTVSGFNDGTNNFSVATGLRYGATTHLSQIVIKNGVFSNVTGVYTAHTSQDINALTRPYLMQLVLENTYLGATNEFVQTVAMSQNSFIASSRHDQSTGNHKAWVREGILSIDTTANMFDVTPSLRMTPSIATYRLKSYVGGSEGLYSIGKWKVAVAAGSTVTATIKVRESVVGDGTDYNGQRARLMVEANTIAGITTDTVLATATAASEGAFETLSGTTSAVSADTVLSFYVDCGYTGYTSGWVNVDTFTATATDSKGLKYWVDGMPYVVGNNVDAGGGGGGSGWYAGE
jgi:hypothetical protein